MAKRHQNTGMPRKDRKNNDLPEDAGFLDRLLGNPKSRVEREDALNTLIQRVVIGIIVLVAAIIAITLIYDSLIVPQLTVATVNGENISVAEFRDRVAFERGIAVQNYSVRYNQLQQQAAAFNSDVNQLVQQDQQMQALIQELNSPDILGNRVLNDMIDDLLIKQEFDAQGLTLDEAQVEYARQDFFGFDPTEVALIGTPATATVTPTITPTPFVSPTPSPTPLPTQTPTVTPSPTLDPEATVESTSEATAEVTSEATEFVIPPTPTTSQTEAYDNLATSVGIFSDSLAEAEVNQASIDQFWERQAIRSAVSDRIIGDLTTAQYANVRHILVATEEDAQAVIAAIQAGESFASLAQARSTDTGSGQNGGDLGWQPIDVYVPEFAEAVRNAEVGQLLDPVESQFGWHIIQVLAREERDLPAATAPQIEQTRFNTWLEDHREALEAADQISINDDWPNYLN